MISQTDLRWMNAALAQAQRCLRKVPLATDVPVGAVCVWGGKIIGSGCNERELRNDPMAHAEIVALRRASRAAQSWQLQNATLYVTLEPCIMCAGAIMHARIGRLVFGAWDEKYGACGSLYDVPRDPRFNHRLQVRGGVMEEDCRELLQNFFQQQRRK